MTYIFALLYISYFTLCHGADTSNLPSVLKGISTSVFPGLRNLAVDVWNHPEIGTQEHYAHDIVVDYFTETYPAIWTVTPHAHGIPTAWELAFENRPQGFTGDLPAIGFLAEYDALLGIGHACGHNHIMLNGLASADIARKALMDLDIPGRIVVVGCPDEENNAGKQKLQAAGAFDGIDLWMMAHPTASSAVQPMQARVNALAIFKSDTHAAAVRQAYDALVLVIDLAGNLPGTASTATPVEDVGMFSSNVVQTQIKLGIAGTTIESVQETVSGILDSTYPNVTFTVESDPDGVALTANGPGGHASEGTKSPLRLTVETFRKLSSDSAISFFLPSNTSQTELDITISVRSRFTLDLDSVLKVVTDTIKDKATNIATDLPYPALEVVPFLPQTFINLMGTPDYGSQTDWVVSKTAPAATDASFIQNAVVDPDTRALVSVSKVVFHPNFRICSTEAGAVCGFNHEPIFRETSGTDFSYTRTEIVARGLAHIAVELMNNSTMMTEATAIIKP